MRVLFVSQIVHHTRPFPKPRANTGERGVCDGEEGRRVVVRRGSDIQIHPAHLRRVRESKTTLVAPDAA